MSRRLLPAAVCVVALLAVAIQGTRAAEPTAVAASRQQAGSKATVLDKKTGGAARPAVSTVAVVKPAAYRNKDDLPDPYRAQKPLTAYTDPVHDALYQQNPSTAYPNANPGYQPRPYQDPGYGTAHGYQLDEPVKGYAHTSYSNPAHNPLQYSAIAPYQQPYATAPAYQGAYHSSPELHASAQYGSKDPSYWHSYQQAPTYTNTGAYYYGSEHPAYSRALGPYDLTNQQPLRGVYRSHQGAYSLATQPARAHHPTMAHQEDPYAAQQQAALSALSAAAGANSLSTLGGGYAALYNKQAAVTGGLYNTAAADPVSEQWWQDHQQLQPTQGQPATGDKLDALLTLINKLAP